MQLHNYSIHHKLIIILILLFPISSIATVKEVTLFPNSAKISETAKINPQCDKGKCISVITLPSQADPESLVVSLPAQSHVKIEDVQVKPIPVQDETKIAELAGRNFLIRHIVNPNAPTAKLQRFIMRKRPDIVVFGHTHKRFCETIGGVLYLNPGYAGKPKPGLERSAVILHCSGKEIRAEYFKL